MNSQQASWRDISLECPKTYEDEIKYRQAIENNLIKDLRKSGDYSRLAMWFGNTAEYGCMNARDALLMMYPEIPKSQKYQVVFDVFTMLKQPASDLLDLVLDVRKYRPDKILDPLRELTDPSGNLIVYRGSGKKERYPQYSMSWTLNKDIAVFFARDYWLTRTQKNAYYIYRGVINIDDIIHYTNDREESEIVQFNSVKNIQVERLLI